ncbi:serine/threonine protein kinase, AGC [Cladochytrium tenue]|nr:serine/threonine protein kinase, AGC [Cladochytrium tenue]
MPSLPRRRARLSSLDRPATHKVTFADATPVHKPQLLRESSADADVPSSASPVSTLQRRCAQSRKHSVHDVPADDLPEPLLRMANAPSGSRLAAFDVLALIGRGALASVHLVRERRDSSDGAVAHANNGDSRRVVRSSGGGSEGSDQLFALKAVRKNDAIMAHIVPYVLRERRLHALIGGVVIDGQNGEAAAGMTSRGGSRFVVRLVDSFQDAQYVYMLQEFVAGGDLWSLVRRMGYFEAPEARFFAAEIVVALEYVHDEMGVIYRDLKPENILVTSSGHIKLTDFGLAKSLASLESGANGVAAGKANTFCGTPAYMAPEVILRQPYTTAVDWWAAGIVLYEMLAGYPPFYAATPPAVYNRVLTESDTGVSGAAAAGRMRWSSRVDGDARRVLACLLDSDPLCRLGAPLLLPPQVATADDAPAQHGGGGGGGSGGAAAVKAHAWFADVDWAEVAAGRAVPPFVPGDAPLRRRTLPADGAGSNGRGWVIGDGVEAWSPLPSVVAMRDRAARPRGAPDDNDCAADGSHFAGF